MLTAKLVIVDIGCAVNLTPTNVQNLDIVGIVKGQRDPNRTSPNLGAVGKLELKAPIVLVRCRDRTDAGARHTQAHDAIGADLREDGAGDGHGVVAHALDHSNQSHMSMVYFSDSLPLTISKLMIAKDTTKEKRQGWLVPVLWITWRA